MTNNILVGTHMNVIHNCRKLGVFSIESVDGVHGRVEVLHILGVHLEEWSILDHNVSNALIFRSFLPLGHSFFKLKLGNIVVSK